MSSDAPKAPDPTGETRTHLALLLVTICLIAVNMRATITGIGPLLEQMSEHTGATIATLSGLTSVPLICWALVSPLTHSAARRFGFNRVVLTSLILLGVGTAIRSLTGIPGLWAGTVLIGVSLAFANVLLPAVVKRSFGSRVAVVTSVYTALLAGCGAIASGVVVPVSHIDAIDGTAWGWRIALLATAAVLPLAALGWFLHMRRSGPDRGTRRTPGPRGPSVWGDGLAWQVGLYFGAQASYFYVLLTWLAPISRSVGRSEAVAGFDVMMYQITGVIGSLCLPLILRGSVERIAPAVLPVLGLAGVVGLLTAPDGVLWWGMIIGLSSGASLAMSFTLMASRARDHASASALSGMSQSVGYAGAAFPPVIFGALHQATGAWTASLWLVIALMALQAILGPLVGRDRHVLEPRG